MRFTPLTLILIVLAFIVLGGGHYYNGGTYANYGYGFGSLLVVLFILFLCGVL